jgi:muconolactone delta-isomerase
VKCFVTFRLKPEVTPEQYEEWFRAENVQAVRKLKSIRGYRVWRVAGVMEGTSTFDYLEEMEIDDKGEFERELEELPEMAAMLEGWYSRVADQVIVYGEEVRQD